MDSEAEQEKKRWIDVVKHNLEQLQLMLEDIEDRGEWRRTSVADFSPEGYTALRREMSVLVQQC